MFNHFLFISLYLSFPILSKLLCVVEVNRHGARASENFPEQPLQQLFGISMKLSSNGYRQHQILGQYMHNKYTSTGFIDKTYREDDFQIISTPTQRTIYSASGFISGLYPNHVVKVTHHDKRLQLISNDTIPVPDGVPLYTEVPITVLDWEENSIFNSWNCKLNGEIIKPKTTDKSVYPDLLTVSEKDMDYSAKYMLKFFNLSKSSFNDMSSEQIMKQINKYVITYFYHYGRNMDDELPKRVVDTIKKMYINKWYNPRLQDSSYLKLGSSEFLQQVLNMFSKVVDAHSNNFLKVKQKYKKYTVYSSHDTAIVNILANILDEGLLNKIVQTGVSNSESYNFLVPPFASHLLFELHRDDQGQFYVVIIYNGRVLNYPLRVITKSKSGEKVLNGSQIEWSNFVEFVKSRIDDSYKMLDCSESEKEEKPQMFPVVNVKNKQQSKSNKIKNAIDDSFIEGLLGVNKLIYNKQ